MTAQELKQYVEDYIKTKTAAESTAIAIVAEGIVDMVVEQFIPKDGSKTLTDVNFTSALKAKVDSIMNGATANDTDANLKNRANHTGTQAISSISGLQGVLDSKPATTTLLDNDGKILISKLPDAPLSPDQFEEYNLNGIPTLRLKESYLVAFGAAQGWTGGGTPTPTLSTSVITFGTSTTTQNVVNWSNVPNATAYTVRRSTSSGMIGSTTIYAGGNLTFTDTGLAADTVYYYTVTASATNYNSSTSTVSSKATSSAGGGGEFVVERTILGGFKGEYNNANPSSPISNVLHTSDLNNKLSVANGYTSQDLVDTTGAATGITITNSAAFDGSTGQISGTAVTTGCFPNDLINKGWKVNTAITGAITFNGLNSNKYYHLHFLMPTTNTSIIRGVEMNGVTKTKGPSDPFLTSFGSAGTGLADPEFITFNNLQGSSLVAIIKVISGGYSGEVSMFGIEVSSVAKP